MALTFYSDDVLVKGICTYLIIFFYGINNLILSLGILSFRFVPYTIHILNKLDIM